MRKKFHIIETVVSSLVWMYSTASIVIELQKEKPFYALVIWQAVMFTSWLVIMYTRYRAVAKMQREIEKHQLELEEQLKELHEQVRAELAKHINNN